MRKEGFLKKTAACTMSFVMLLFGASTAWGGTFADTLKTDMEKDLEAFAAQWDEGLEKANGQNSATVDLSLHLSSSGNTLVQLFAGLNLSWLDRLGVKMDYEVLDDGTENAVIDLYANEQTLATMLMAIDLLNGTEKIMIPELSPSAIFLNMELPEGESALASSKIMLDLMKDPKASLPDGNTAKELLSRYCGLIMDHMQDGDTAESDVTVGEISEDCTLYEGILDEAGMQDLVTDILTTAKEDEQLAEVVKNLEGASEDLSGLYDGMISAIDEALADVEEETSADGEASADDEASADSEASGTLLTSKIYVNADGEVIGSEVSLGEDLNVDFLVPSADGKTGFETSITSDGETYGIAGIGTVEDDVVTGSYQLMANGVAVANAEVDGLNLKTGRGGTVTLSLAENMPDEETYGMLGGFKIECSMDGDETSGEMKLALVMNGEPLGELLMTAVTKDLDIDVSALDSAEKVYDANNDEDMAAYASEMDLNPLLENVTAAGAPEDFVEKLLNMATGSKGEPAEDDEVSDDTESAEEADEETDTDTAA